VFATDGTTKLANARITVLHNGYPIHWNSEVVAKTGGGQPEAPHPLPILLQDHGNPVVFRNIWIVLPPEPAIAGKAPPQAAMYAATGFGSGCFDFRWRLGSACRRWHRCCCCR